MERSLQLRRQPFCRSGTRGCRHAHLQSGAAELADGAAGGGGTDGAEQLLDAVGSLYDAVRGLGLWSIWQTGSLGAAWRGRGRLADSAHGQSAMAALFSLRPDGVAV